jgi:hypothetical protein
MTWLAKPYYALPEPQTYVQSPIMNWPPSILTTTLSLECALQSELASTMSDIAAYLNPNFNTFLPARSLQALINDFIAQAMNRLMWYPASGAGVDPVALGTKYGKLQMSLMQQIDSGDGVTSLWDAWIAMQEPVK